jgi:threonyl-tRNA synthetase
MEQINSEIKGVLDFLKAVYDVFGFTFKLLLSTRPDDYLGDVKTWEHAETQLKEALDEFGAPWKLNPGDGAFYGPKIDITVTDALKRHHQCATVQLDFQLPERFNLSFVDEKGEKQKPVIIHRAILGSIERFTAVLTENYGGKWPFWISPRQAVVIPIHSALNDYASEVAKELYEKGFEAEADLDDGNTLQKKVRNAQLAQYNFILVVGPKEKENGTVNVRNRLNEVLGEFTVGDVACKFKSLEAGHIKNSEELFGQV